MWWWQRFARYSIHRPPDTSFGIVYHQSNNATARLDVYRAQTPEQDKGLPEPASLSRVSSMATLPDVDQGTRYDASEFAQSPWHESVPLAAASAHDLRPVVVFLYDVGMMGPVRPHRWMFGLLGLKLAEQGYGKHGHATIH